MPDESTDPPNPDAPPRSARERLFGWLRMVLLWSPALVTAFLVKTHAVNSMLWDDWWLAEDWLKYLKGEFRWTELFAVQMEHRLAVPRAISLGLNTLFEGDIRAQNAVSLLALVAIAAMMLRLVQKSFGPLRGGTWWLAFAMMAALFSPVQWQPLLWPIIFTVYLAMALVVGAVLVWFRSGRKVWPIFAISLCLAVLATLTFASGMLAWPLVVLAIVFGPHPGETRQKAKCAGLWVAAAAICLSLYFHDFSSDVHPQYAYGQAEENTVDRSAGFLLKHPERVFGFVSAAVGGNLARGWPEENLYMAKIFGSLMLLIFLLVFVGAVRRRFGGDIDGFRTRLPWLLVAATSVGTAAMLALGRMWIGDGPQAVTARYTMHGILLAGSLPALVAFLMPARKDHWLSMAKGPLFGIFLSILALQWMYGRRMMEIWSNSRWSDAGMIQFAGLLADPSHFSYIAGDGEFGVRVAKEINALKHLSPPLLENRLLKNLKTNKHSVNDRNSAFLSFVLTPEKGAIAEGYSKIGDERPADLVLFTQDGPEGEEIRGLRTPLFIVSSASAIAHRDFEFTRNYKPEEKEKFNWGGPVTILAPFDPALPVRAYAYDAKRRRAFSIPDQRPERRPDSTLRSPN
ncbi:MAG: hypothetical protein ACKO2G_00950 [Verrucomicrobiales bacterium]